MMLNKEFSMVYKPTKLIIGKDNKFLIKAKPGSYVVLATSNSNYGAPIFHGQKLRLGDDYKISNGIVPANGLLELNIALPNNKDLNETTVYFEAIVSKDKDFTDSQVARIMAPSGRETESNSVLVNLPPDDSSKPNFTPTIPGAPLEMYRTMQYIEQMKNTASTKDKEDRELLEDNGSFYSSPVILRNLQAPELNRGK